eukprot:1105411-Alexandrium_andersonii.AAC.1
MVAPPPHAMLARTMLTPTHPRGIRRQGKQASHAWASCGEVVRPSSGEGAGRRMGRMFDRCAGR